MSKHSRFRSLAAGAFAVSALVLSASAFAHGHTPSRHHTAAHHSHAHAHAHRRLVAAVPRAEEHYVQAPVERLGDDELQELGSSAYGAWAAEYDYAARDRVCSGKRPLTANAHLLRGCLLRFHNQQKLDAYWSS